MQKVGIDCATDLTRISLPTLERCLLIRWLIRFQMQSLTKPKTTFFLLPMMDESPKYLLDPMF